MSIITEEGIVTELDTSSNTAWVKTQRKGACESCSAKSSCHTLGGGKEEKVQVLNNVSANIGDRIILCIESAPLLKITFILYIFTKLTNRF